MCFLSTMMTRPFVIKGPRVLKLQDTSRGSQALPQGLASPLQDSSSCSKLVTHTLGCYDLGKVVLILHH